MSQKRQYAASKVGLGLASLALVGGAAAAGAVPANAASTATWDALAQCESTGNWSINTGNGYYGGVQFSLSTWRGFGGSGMPHQASKAEQIRIAEKVLATQGWGAWPACSAKLGLYGKSGSIAGSTKATTSKTSTSVAPKTVKAPVAKKATVAKKTVAAPKATVAKKTVVAPKASETAKKAVAKTPAAKKSAVLSQKSAPVAKKSAPAKTYTAKHVADSGENYTVRSGDSLSKIANKLGLKSWQDLYLLNKGTVSNPNLIFPGQTLNVPA